MQCECGDSYIEYIDEHDWEHLGDADGYAVYMCNECEVDKYEPLN